MFEVLCQQLNMSSSDLESKIRTLNIRLNELRTITNNLHSLSGMDAVIKKLRIEEENLSMQIGKLDSMKQGLTRINQTYRTCENRIQDEIEQNCVKYPARKVTGLRLDSVNAIIPDFSL